MSVDKVLWINSNKIQVNEWILGTDLFCALFLPQPSFVLPQFSSLFGKISTSNWCKVSMIYQAHLILIQTQRFYEFFEENETSKNTYFVSSRKVNEMIILPASLSLSLLYFASLPILFAHLILSHTSYFSTLIMSLTEFNNLWLYDLSKTLFGFPRFSWYFF